MPRTKLTSAAAVDGVVPFEYYHIINIIQLPGIYEIWEQLFVYQWPADLSTTTTVPASVCLDYVIDFHDHRGSHDNFESLLETGLASEHKLWGDSRYYWQY